MSYIKVATFTVASLFSLSALAEKAPAPTESQIASAMQGLIQEMNKQLPKKIDEITTLNKVSYNNKVISYDSVIDNKVSITPDIEKVIIEKTCTTPQTRKLINDYNFTYRYNYVNGDKKPIASFDINKQTCAK